MGGIRRIIKKKEIILGVIAIIFVSVYMFQSKHTSILLRFINGIFVIGLIYTLIGMAIYIRNVGLFKTFRYFAYKIRAEAYSRKNVGQINTMSLAEFTQEIMSERNQRSGKVYYLYGMSLVIVSYLLAWIKL